MAREKQYVFSARTTEEGLGLLNKLKADLKIGWDELVVEAVCGHYGLDKAVMTLPKAEPKPKQEKQPKVEKPRAEKKAKAKAKVAGKPEVTPEPATEAEAPERVAAS